MVKLCEITHFLEKEFPPEYAEDFDNIGLLAGRCEKDVSKVILCLDCNKNIVKEAAEKGAELIITHHPVIFNPIKCITDATDSGDTLVFALENGISIYSVHTNMDSAPDGITDTISDKLGLKAVKSMEGNVGRLCKAQKGTTAKSLINRIKEVFGIKTLYSTFTGDREIKTVAICNGGGGGSLTQIARELGADVYISGDLKHHEISEFKISDTTDFIEIRHYDCEIIAREILKERLEAKFKDKLEIFISDAEVSPLLDTAQIM